MSSKGFHEAADLLSEPTRNMHRAITSLIEELEAIDWYHQRAEACSDDALRAILVHNRNEEIEHAAMTLEWIRRQSPEMDAAIGTYIGTQGEITKLEHESRHLGIGLESHGETAAETTQMSLGIGSLRVMMPSNGVVHA